MRKDLLGLTGLLVAPFSTNQSNGSDLVTDEVPRSTMSATWPVATEKLRALHEAVRIRVTNIPPQPIPHHSSPQTRDIGSTKSSEFEDGDSAVAILFSGGLDSAVLAAMCGTDSAARSDGRTHQRLLRQSFIRLSRSTRSARRI